MKSIKKTLCLFLTILMMVSAITPVMASNDIKVEIDGHQIAFDVPPQLINDRTMVPLRAIFEALGATVDWDNDTQTVTSTKDSTTISLTINNPIMYVNGASVTLDSPACLVSGRTLVPVRAISEAFSVKVRWEDSIKTVLLSTTGEFVEPNVTMYAADGRTQIVPLNQVEANKAVGWYTEPMTTMYALDGRTQIIPQSQVEANKAVGWYTEPVTMVYAADGRTLIIATSEIEAYKAVGWYISPLHAKYHYYPSNNDIPTFDSVTENRFLKKLDNFNCYYYEGTNYNGIKEYEDILTSEFGWKYDGMDTGKEIKIINNTTKQVTVSMTLWFVKGARSIAVTYDNQRMDISVHLFNNQKPHS